MVMCMSMLYPVSKLTKSIVEEKETRMKEVMKIMGLQDWVLAAAWSLTYLFVFAVIGVVDTLMLSSTALETSDPVLLFIFLMLFFSSLVTFSFLISVFFSRAKLAAIVAPIALFSTLMPRYIFFRAEDDEMFYTKMLASLFSPTAFTFAADRLAEFEGAGFGLSWDNLAEGEFSFGVCMFMMIVDFWLYGFLAWYLDKVMP